MRQKCGAGLEKRPGPPEDRADGGVGWNVGTSALKSKNRRERGKLVIRGVLESYDPPSGALSEITNS
jgi:hypothetical protein